MNDELNPKQKEAVEYGEGPMLIVAGAGSGKTKTLTSRLAYLISQKGVKPERILAITFTNKAADEMKERVKKSLFSSKIKISNEPFVGTFHSFGAGILRKEGKFFGRNYSFSIFDRDDSISAIKKILKNFNISVSDFSPTVLIKEFSKIKSELLDEEDFQESEKSKKIYFLFKEYESFLERNNAFDFDDLLEKVFQLFSKNKEVLKRYQSQYDYVLVDEYQDTNSVQYRLVKMLSEAHKNINVVGDDQQAIYGFRFSDFRNFLNFEKDWPEAKIIFLEQNYRSTKNIINSSSGLISNNVLQKPKKLWTQNQDGSLVKIAEHDDEFEEADFVIQTASGYLRQNKNVGILFRTNAQSRALEQMLLEYGVEYNLFGAITFYERKEIKDLVAALKYCANPSDEISLSRLEKNFYKKTYLKIKEELPLKSSLKPDKIIDYFIKATDYIAMLEKTYPNFSERLENIQELIYFSQQFSKLPNFLEKISLASPLDESVRKKRDKKYLSGINMMTIHLAKGLEFDVVFVVGVNEGLLPHQRSFFSSQDVEEERRLMYVAMTRAREELYLSFYNLPSRFLSELPSNNLEFAGKRAFDDEERYIEYD